MKRDYRAPHLPIEERIAEALEKLVYWLPWFLVMITLMTVAVLFK